jgi:ABC-type multidrug transport system permease subunit
MRRSTDNLIALQFLAVILPVSLVLFLAIGALAFRSIGLIVAAVSNSMAESNVLVQLLYMPMMFLSGATIPIAMIMGAYMRWVRAHADDYKIDPHRVGIMGSSAGGHLTSMLVSKSSGSA